MEPPELSEVLLHLALFGRCGCTGSVGGGVIILNSLRLIFVPILLIIGHFYDLWPRGHLGSYSETEGSWSISAEGLEASR